MSLDYAVSEVKNWQEVCLRARESEAAPMRLQPVTHAIVWSALGVDLGTISKDNIDEWMYRLAMMDVIDCRLMKQPISRADLERHIGLRTNVATTTRRKFHAKIITILQDRTKARLRAS